MAQISDELIAPFVLKDKLESLAERLLRGVTGHGTGRIRPALQNAISMKGMAHFSTFEAQAAQIYRIEHYYHVETLLTEALLNLSRQKNLDVQVSWDPIHPQRVDALFWPTVGLCVMIQPDWLSSAEGADVEVIEPEDAACEKETAISAAEHKVVLRRYVDADLVRGLRPQIRSVQIMERQLREAACFSLQRAAGYHFELEEIYSGAMDFVQKEEFTRAFCNKVLA